MTCPNCRGGAVVTSPMPGAGDLTVNVCASCGLRWSAIDCDTRGCRERAVARCKITDCQKFRCKGHGPGKSGICLACSRRTANVVKGGRSSWVARTGRSDQ